MKHLQPHLLSDGALFERSSFAGLLKFLRTAKNVIQTNHCRGTSTDLSNMPIQVKTDLQ
jgi:hypothetical protein